LPSPRRQRKSRGTEAGATWRGRSLSGASGSILLRCGMERATLENDLSRAEAHVANGQKRIAQQHQIIAELDREGHDTAPAKDMLTTFERTQAMHVANRDRIAGKLATLD
jgi:hypothetical protein